MSGVTDYAGYLEGRIRANIIFSITVFLLLAFGAFMVIYLNKKYVTPKKTKFKTQRKALEYRKEVRKARIYNIILLTLVAALGCLSVSICAEVYTDCTYDIEHSNYITYSGDVEVEVQYQPRLGKGFRRVGVMTFYEEGNEVTLEFSLSMFDLPEGTYEDMTVVYSERSGYLLSISKAEE